MKANELKQYTAWIAENYNVYRGYENLWETKDGMEIVHGNFLAKKYQNSGAKKRKGVFGFLAKLLPFLILPILPIKPTVRDTVRTDSVRMKELPPVAVWVIRSLPKNPKG